MLELRVVTGARAGTRERFDKSVITLGRHPLSDLRFEPQEDLVSTRHAELRAVDGEWTIHDQDSTNGTFVNGERIREPRRVIAGDAISLGFHGPRVELHPVQRTTARIAQAVHAETASLRRGFFVTVGVLVVAGVAGFTWWQRQSAAHERALLATIARSQTPPASSTPTAAVAAMDIAAIREKNDGAVALIASDLDGTFMAGTAFGVAPSGLLVTNRHVVQTQSGAPPRRLRVLYANTNDWLAAHVVRTSDADDLALIQLDSASTHPVVSGVSRDGAIIRVGTPIVSIGFPHAVDTPMEGRGLHVTARTSTATGTVSKQLDDVMQIDAYAGKGSSGSPVFDSRGLVVGVVYGGAPESGGRIVYAVPARRLVAFLGSDGASVVR
ncbi:MAG: trypsin-like peptidase domain-containing protein [Gemmatimonadaceae bacterium]